MNANPGRAGGAPEGQAKPTGATEETDDSAWIRRLAGLVRAVQGLDAETTWRQPLGSAFDVVVFSAMERGHRVVAELDALQPGGCGPVVAQHGLPWLYALVPPGTHARWVSPYAVCYGRPRQWMLMPPASHTHPFGTYWLRPMRHTHLVGPGMLAQALSRHRPEPPPAPAPKPPAGGPIAGAS
ncbi:hypothetical protein [Streptomyces sp. NBC_01304]|uniref:hypothetical protein n=1 Tax=Streptomyces sp. NBC_01304 TaxID=2903818 RepID=UPI002E12BD85|nr:hypothetical protein OG430_48195 [Streptomyces sp. NBC_01304]